MVELDHGGGGRQPWGGRLPGRADREVLGLNRGRVHLVKEADGELRRRRVQDNALGRLPGLGGEQPELRRVPSALSRPPLTVLPASDGSGSAPAISACFTCATVAFGRAIQASAATPATCGALIDVPLSRR